MGEMGLGYGSEYQLLRFLGHHRNYLNGRIQEILGTQEEIHWLDYPSNYGKASLDAEWVGIECFKDEPNFDEIRQWWDNFWPSKTKAQNWDGIFRVGSKWYFVEAKAHEEETRSSCKASDPKSVEMINQAFGKVAAHYKSSKGNEWASADCKSYQLANRLAFIYFCRENGIDAALLYISFLNGYDKPGEKGRKNITTIAEWERIWQDEFDELGIDMKAVEGSWYNLCIDCAEHYTNI